MGGGLSKDLLQLISGFRDGLKKSAVVVGNEFQLLIRILGFQRIGHQAMGLPQKAPVLLQQELLIRIQP